MSVAYALDAPKRGPTPRQAAVLALWDRGVLVPAIAAELGMAKQTVYQHLSQLLRAGLRTDARRITKDEPPGESQSRIDRDIASGVRCARCWLPKPCDHE